MRHQSVFFFHSSLFLSFLFRLQDFLYNRSLIGFDIVQDIYYNRSFLVKQHLIGFDFHQHSLYNYLNVILGFRFYEDIPKFC